MSWQSHNVIEIVSSEAWKWEWREDHSFGTSCRVKENKPLRICERLKASMNDLEQSIPSHEQYMLNRVGYIGAFIQSVWYMFRGIDSATLFAQVQFSLICSHN